MQYLKEKIFSLCIFIIILNISIFSYADTLINIYKINNKSIRVFKTKFMLTSKSGDIEDLYCVKPWEIKDCCLDAQNRCLLTILGKPKAPRGERLAIFSINGGKIKKIWIGKDYGYNPWKIIAADVDGDFQLDICVGVWKKARFHPVFDNRLFIYNWDGNEIFPKWLGSRLSSPFVDFDFYDIDGDGIKELITLEIQRNGLKRIMSYKWKGFGFEGFKILEKNLSGKTLHKFKLKKEKKEEN